jgi:hypothetical protein
MATVMPSTSTRSPHIATHATTTPSVTGTRRRVDVLRGGGHPLKARSTGCGPCCSPPRSQTTGRIFRSKSLGMSCCPHHFRPGGCVAQGGAVKVSHACGLGLLAEVDRELYRARRRHGGHPPTTVSAASVEHRKMRPAGLPTWRVRVQVSCPPPAIGVADLQPGHLSALGHVQGRPVALSWRRCASAVLPLCGKAPPKPEPLHRWKHRPPCIAVAVFRRVAALRLSVMDCLPGVVTSRRADPRTQPTSWQRLESTMMPPPEGNPSCSPRAEVWTPAQG